MTVDTLRADHLGVYGFPGDISPNLDALASRGILFEQAIAASTVTAPSHASIMTSRYVREHAIGVVNGHTRLDAEQTLALRFQQAGWETAAFVSNPTLKRRVGLDRGFDSYDDELEQAEPNRDFMFERTADRTTEQATAWLAQHRTRPYFLWVHYQDPHGPYTPPLDHSDRFRDLGLRREPALPVLDDDGGRGGIPAYQALPRQRRPGQYRARYAGEVHFFDAGLGVLLDAVERSQGPRETIILLTADHGESFGEGGYYFAHGHATTPELARVPFLLVTPGQEPERRKDLVHHVDVLPTLLELAGLPVPEDARGVALGIPLRAGKGLPERLVFCEIEAEVAAYEADRFVRVPTGDLRHGAQPEAWTTWTWAGARAWTAAPPAKDLVPQILEHLANEVPRVALPQAPEAELRLLRALGYTEPADGR